MFNEAFDNILRGACTPAVVRAIEEGGNPSALWDAVADAGFLELLAPESAGGAGLSLPEFFPILLLLGRRAAPLPLAQSMVARALLPGGAVPTGMTTLAPAHRRTDDGGWVCAHVPFGTIADDVLVDDGNSLCLLSCASVRRIAGQGQLASLHWPADVDVRRFSRNTDVVRAFGAALHAALMAGAMGHVFDMTLQYANDRVQFGKAIGKFQAIQHQLSEMAEQVAASRMAAEAAFRTDSSTPALLTSAMAKARTSEASVMVCAIAHAVHGAIGMTEEFDLQLYTRRLHAWRMAHGSEAYWHRVVGEHVMAADGGMVEFVRAVAA